MTVQLVDHEKCECDVLNECLERASLTEFELAAHQSSSRYLKHMQWHWASCCIIGPFTTNCFVVSNEADCLL